MTHQAPPFRLAYLTGVYPLASHTFIQREIAALRALGSDITITSIRQPEAKELIGPEEEAARAETFYVLAAAKNPFRLLGDHAALFAQSPMRWLKTLWLALRTNRPGLKGWIWQFFYFAEAGVLARHLRKTGHLASAQSFCRFQCNGRDADLCSLGHSLQFYPARADGAFCARKLAYAREGRARGSRGLHQPFRPQPGHAVFRAHPLAQAQDRALRRHPCPLCRDTTCGGAGDETAVRRKIRPCKGSYECFSRPSKPPGQPILTSS